MTLQFPRYSKSGKKLEEADIDYSIVFSLAFQEKVHKDLLCTSLRDYHEVDNICRRATSMFKIEREIIPFDERTSAKAGVFEEWSRGAGFWAKEEINHASMLKMAEDYIEKRFPLLEPPTFGEEL